MVLGKSHLEMDDKQGVPSDSGNHQISSSPFATTRPCHGPEAPGLAAAQRVQRAAVLRGDAQRQLGAQLVAGPTLGRGERGADAR